MFPKKKTQDKQLRDENLRLMEPYKRRADEYQKSLDNDRELMEYHKRLMEDYQRSIDNFGKGTSPSLASPPKEKPEPAEKPDVRENQNDGIKHYVIPF